MISHKTCGGRIIIDRTYSTEQRIELNCLRCGTDWVLTSLENPLMRFFLRQEYGLKVKADGK